jgi:hypothetical protein
MEPKRPVGDFASNTLGFLRAEFAAEYRRAIAAKVREAMLAARDAEPVEDEKGAEDEEGDDQ